ncbi:hypothetical protein JTE90_027963 [Oedothorax gibbosus]|uniref:Vitellogenin n=1 Tax=Oedothorax gibbosus TaxID=931172 RepID=A0AAV6VET0_9ARAC|nr:hypothetical protein JTE90_027963 [Oedothorax gibbosus]
MKSLVAAALAIFVVELEEAHHTPSHVLGYPKFVQRMTHLYDVSINMTSGVPGMHSQVAKSVMSMELKIFAKSQSELIISMHRVRVSDSLPGVESSTEALSLKPYPELEEKLKIPIKAILEQGMIKSYTLDHHETLESQKIKRTILRHFEIYLDRKLLNGGVNGVWPLTYNVTRESPLGNFQSHYIVTSSPNVAFPVDKNVFNISRVDNFETIPYLAYKTHHNFQEQGCPEVCKKDHVENRFGAGCPSGFEPYHTPMKRSFVQHHNLKTAKTGDLIIDMIRTKETHVADVYDQNMEVTIRSVIKFRKANTEVLKLPSGQVTKTDLHDMTTEINEEQINEKCHLADPRKAIEQVKSLLQEITSIVVEGNVESEKSKLVGEKLILLQKALTVMKQGDLRIIKKSVVTYDELESASLEDKVKRQIWLDNLPIIGTSESVSFIVQLIKENVNKPNKVISIWEAKSILESLPNNIIHPTGKTVLELTTLLDIISNPRASGYKMFYSAAHLTVSRVIRSLCSEFNGIPLDELSRLNSEEEAPQEFEQPELFAQRHCPRLVAKKFVQDIANKLKSTTDKSKRVIYIETLARTGLHQVLSIIRPYVFGHFSGLTPSYTDYVRVVTINTLHNLVSKHSKEVQDIVLPVFFNKTESPKVRNAAFAVYARSHPTLGSLQHVAEQTWKEPSVEVGSFVTSTLETLGNSTTPCHQLTAQRIKKVLPQIKRVVRGNHHAKNMYWSLFDKIRGFGLETRFEHTPSNESFFPSTLYGALGYNADSLRDIFFQYALISQGVTSRNVWDELLIKMGIKTAEDIPQSKEKAIFPDMEIDSRDPEFWRFTVYEKLFYSTSYYYFDAEESNKIDIMAMVKENIKHYFTRNAQGIYEGQFVKVFIPSSYRSKAVGHALPYPVEFEMRNPLVISLKLRFNQTPTPGFGNGYTADIIPSVYYSTLYSNQMLNLGDCKHVGVYHEKRVAVTYPIRIRVALEKSGKFRMSYSFPELPKKIFTFNSEAGTYAGKRSLEMLPSVENRKTIKTLPSQFEHKESYGIFGLPKFERVIMSEDIQQGREETPRTPTEAVHQFLRHFLNAGWRRKSIDIVRVPDVMTWPTSKTQLQINLDFIKNYVSVAQGASGNWLQNLKLEDNLEEHDTLSYAHESSSLHKALSTELDHIQHQLNVKVEQLTEEGKPGNSASFHVDYLHTLNGTIHFAYVNASTSIQQLKPMFVTGYHAVAFIERPNEFKYDPKKFGEQIGLTLSGLAFNKDVLTTEVDVVAKSLFTYEPLDHVLNKHMNPQVPAENFLPENYEECVRDVAEGKAQSVACIRAMREHAIYNKLKLHAIWKEDTCLPSIIRKFGHKLDLALKYAYYPHISEMQRQTYPYGFKVEATYIDKMTDEPVVDIKLVKPEETLKLERISAGWVQPMSSIDNIMNTYAQRFTNNTYPATCAFMDKYVRTYDMKTFRMPKELPEHTYILSTHCTQNKKFAVLVDYESRKVGTKKVHIYLGNHYITLVPGSRSEYTIKFDDKEQVVSRSHSIELDTEQRIFAVVIETNDRSSFIEIHAKKAGIKVVYDGKNAKVEVEPRYKGELCGLCSEYNGEIVHELRGVDRCLYSSSEDFAKSNIVGHTGDKEPKYSVDCRADDITFTSQEEQQSSQEEGSEPTLKRNKVISRADQLCFSVKPVPVCANNAMPIETKSEEVDFHCLPKVDTNARKMVAEANRRILGEVETKSVDHTRVIEVAKMC